MPNSFMKNIWRLRMTRRHRVNGFRLRPIRSLPIIISGFIKRLLALLKPNASKNKANAAADDDTASGESRRDQEPAAENDEAGLPVDDNTNRASAQANGGDGAADSGDATPKKRRSPRNGATKNEAADNGANDRTNMSPAQLAEAVQDDQDSDQPS
jgi:hypothetical protein